MDDLFDRAEFRAWLEEQDPDVTVGQACWPFHCPLASYGRVQLEHRRFESGLCVLEEEYRLIDGEYPLPNWARSFVSGVDRSVKGATISASAALAILDGIAEAE